MIKNLFKRIVRIGLAAFDSDPLPAHVIVGRHTYGVTRSMCFHPTASAPLTIGNFCSVAKGVMFICHANHPINLPSTFPFRSRMTRMNEPITDPGLQNHDAVTKGGITIGHDVWIGANAIILSGVTIGTGAVIGAGAVVSKDIPPYGIAVGNPAQIVKMRHEKYVSDLLSSRWWDLSDVAIAQLDPEFYNSDIPAFLAAVAGARSDAART